MLEMLFATPFAAAHEIGDRPFSTIVEKDSLKRFFTRFD